MEEKVLLRSEIPEEYKWNLSDLFATDELWETSLKEMSKISDKLYTMQGKIKTKEKLLEALEIRDELNEVSLRVYAYAKMHRDEDNSNSKYQGMTERAMRVMTESEAKCSYLVPEITALGAETVNSWMDGELITYKHYLEDVFRESEHILSAAEEKILTYMSEIGEAPSEIFDMWNDADLTFDDVSDGDKRMPLTHGRYAGYLQSENRDIRKDAFEKMYKAYENFKNTLSATMSANVKKTCYFAQIRKYESALSMALSEDNIHTSVYDNLIKTMRNGVSALSKYLNLKREVLKLDELHMYDLYVPIVSLDEHKYTFDEAKELVLKAVEPLGETYVNDMKRAFSERWVDVYENKGKTSGAYSWGSNDVHPYVLLNFHGTIGDVFTLAHEMGHAMHSYYTNKTQPTIYKNYKIFVAEVASTVNENLLMIHLLKTTEDKKLRAYLIGHRLEEFRTTVYRQTMFAEFERETHAAMMRGEALTSEFLCELYLKLNRDYMGASTVIDDEIKYEWARIPHFYSDFYVYQYATGYSAAVAIANAIIKDKDAVKRYLEFLSSGDSDYPLNLLARAGADLNTPEPIEKAIESFEADIEEFKALLN